MRALEDVLADADRNMREAWEPVRYRQLESATPS